MSKKIKSLLAKLFIFVCRTVFGIKKNRVLFMCFACKTYADNSRAVSEALHAMAPELEIVWLFRDPESKKGIVPEYVKSVKNTYINFLYYTATSISIVNNNVFYDFNKSDKQFLVQLWHGDRPIKRVGYDCLPEDTKVYFPERREGFCNLAVSGSRFCDSQFRTAFKYPGEILSVGSPRDDVLVNGDPERAKKTRKALSISEDKKILVYAPTFRRENRNGAQAKQEIDLEKTLCALEEKFGGEWVCLVRSHPVAGGIVGFEKSSKLMEVSSYEDMADLLLIADMLITDYSSSATDFTLQTRPVIMFQPDIKEYIEKSRTLYFNMEDSPYLIAENQQELEKIIMELTPENIAKNCQDLAEFYGTYETGKSSHETAKRIYDWINK